MSPHRLARAVAYLSTWLVLIAIATTAPPSDGLDLHRVLSWLRLQGEPSLVAVFNLLGVWPMAFLAVLAADRDQPVPAWPFLAVKRNEVRNPREGRVAAGAWGVSRGERGLF